MNIGDAKNTYEAVQAVNNSKTSSIPSTKSV